MQSYCIVERFSYIYRPLISLTRCKYKQYANIKQAN